MPTPARSLDRATAEALEAMRTPPHSIEAEQAVLGGLMLDNTVWEAVADVLIPEDFYQQDHRLIFSTIRELARAHKPFDAVTMAEHLQSINRLEQAGGLAYLAVLARDTPTAANVGSYGEIVRERSQLRELLRIGGELQESIYQRTLGSVAEVVDKTETALTSVVERSLGRNDGSRDIRTHAAKALEQVGDVMKSERPYIGIPTGVKGFDDMTNGLKAGDLVIIAGRPSTGKTSFGMQIADHAAIDLRIPAAVFSMEMPGDQLAMRLIATRARVNFTALQRGKLSREDWDRVAIATKQLEDAPLHIDDTGGLTPGELRTRARRLWRKHGMGILVADYLQLMKLLGFRGTRAEEVGKISAAMKELAKELHVPVIALSQLNRNLEQRSDKRPVNSDLRDSGSLEQDADLIVFTHRDLSVQAPVNRPAPADLIIGKQRNGPIGDVAVDFYGQYTLFADRGAPLHHPTALPALGDEEQHHESDGIRPY